MPADVDSLFPTPNRRARRGLPVTIDVGRRSAWVHGHGIAPLLDEAQVPRMWCPRHKCLTLPVDRVDDLLALLEHRDRRVVTLQVVDR